MKPSRAPGKAWPTSPFRPIRGAGEAVIGASESDIAGGFLAEVIQTLTGEFPRIVIRAAEPSTAALAFTEPLNREMDMMLGRVGNRTLDDDLQAHRLFDEPLFVFAGGQNDWAYRDDIDFVLRHPFPASPVHHNATRSGVRCICHVAAAQGSEREKQPRGRFTSSF